MPEATRAPSAAFFDHYQDPRPPGITTRIGTRLRDHGLVTLDGLDTSRQVLDLAQKLMMVEPHRDSGADGLTVIRNTGRHAGRAGFAGLGDGELLPHTERSGTPRPPRLMLLACGRPAHSGGVSILVDGRAVYEDLAAHHPHALTALSAERSAYFGGGDGHLGAVFTHVGDGRVVVRLRQDELARFSPDASQYLRVLQEVLDRHRIEFTLATGQAYLLDNHRWLHARMAFHGSRLLYRVLGSPRAFLRLPPGFSKTAACAARPTGARSLCVP